MVEIDATESPNLFVSHIAVGIHHLEKGLSFSRSKERRVQKFGDPVHLMRVGQIERHLNVFVRILDNDESVIVDVAVFPFALEENCAALLHFGCSQMCSLEVGDDIRVGQRLNTGAFVLRL